MCMSFYSETALFLSVHMTRISMAINWTTFTLFQQAHHCVNEMVDIWLKMFSNTFSWMKAILFCLKVVLMFVPKGPNDNKSATLWVLAWCWTCDKPLPKPRQISMAVPIYNISCHKRLMYLQFQLQYWMYSRALYIFSTLRRILSNLCNLRLDIWFDNLFL